MIAMKDWKSFMNTHQSTSQYFTIDDDNHGVGILCAHHDPQQQQQRSAATVRLDKNQIRHFMTTHGYQTRANLTSDQNNNPTFTESGFICTRTSSQ
ncbi:unnamed protein product [Absidia cylindrospora]